MDGLQVETLLKWMIWGYPYFWKHPPSFDFWELKELVTGKKTHNFGISRMRIILKMMIFFSIFCFCLGGQVNHATTAREE